MTARPIYGWYGDDFTGATDTLATISTRGRKAFLFLSVPERRHLEEAGYLDAIGIAGRARAMTPGEMRAELAPVGAFFQGIGARLLHYKCCSTFDSAKTLGNIAVALETLRDFAGRRTVPVVGGQPSLGRYCAFSNLFASGGSAVHRLDRHPTMSRHPATPMNEADLAQHLCALGLGAVSAIHWPTIEAGALTTRWAELAATTPDAVLLDALSGAHLEEIGGLLRALSNERPLLAVGPSSVVEAFFSPAPSPVENSAERFDGPVLAFAGSQSPLTRSQVKAASSYVPLSLDVGELAGSEAYCAGVAQRAAGLLRKGRHVLLSTVSQDVPIPVADGSIASRSAALVDRILNQVPVRRLAVAGGDTSSSVAQALGLWGLGYHSQITSGVTLSVSRSERAERDRMLLMLKGGQMGGEDLFEQFLAAS